MRFFQQFAIGIAGVVEESGQIALSPRVDVVVVDFHDIVAFVRILKLRNGLFVNRLTKIFAQEGTTRNLLFRQDSPPFITIFADSDSRTVAGHLVVAGVVGAVYLHGAIETTRALTTKFIDVSLTFTLHSRRLISRPR